MSALGKKGTSAILALLLAVPLLLPTPAYARRNDAGKNTSRAHKQEKKRLKSDLKSSRKATREWRKHHKSIL